MTLKAVFFDMGGTIETYRSSNELRISNAHAIRDCLKKTGISLDLNDEELASLIMCRLKAYHHWNLVSMIEIPSLEIWSKYVFQDYDVNIESVAEELSFLYETRFFEREMRPEIPAVLEEIKSMGIKIGCISNTQSLTQVPFSMKRYGIEQYFNPVVLSSDYGRRKPDASIFYQATRLAGLPTSDCVYVGDKVNRDILGAHRAGFRFAVKIDHVYDDGEKDEGAIPDYLIDNMTELLPILESELLKATPQRSLRKEGKIKAIFFDAGDILYYRAEKNPNFNQFLAERNLRSNPDIISEKQKIKDLAFQGKIGRHDFYERLVRLHGITNPDEIVEGVAALSLDDDTVEIFEGVPETIHKLKEQGYLLGIITDTAMPFSKKLSWFDRHGFGRVWDTVISSKEIGERKPSPKMYEEAISQTGVCASEAIFVGHKASELQGAKAVGLNTVAYNYDKEAIADVYIENFCDLLKVSLLEN